MKLRKSFRLYTIIMLIVVLNLTNVMAQTSFNYLFGVGRTNKDLDINTYEPTGNMGIVASSPKNGAQIKSEYVPVNLGDNSKVYDTGELSQNTLRILNTLKGKEFLIDSNVWGSVGIFSSSIKNVNETNYVEITVNDFSSGLDILSLFKGMNINVLELNKDSHGYNFITSGNTLSIFPKKGFVGQLELLVGDSIVVVVKCNENLLPLSTNDKMTTEKEVTNHMVTKEPIITKEVSQSNTPWVDKNTYDKKENTNTNNTNIKLETTPAKQTTDDYKKSTTITANSSNYLNSTSSIASGVNKSSSSSYSSNSFWGEEGIIKPSVEKKLDTSKIDKNPMKWGVSIDKSDIGKVDKVGDSLLSNMYDKWNLNIDQLTGKEVEFVQKKADKVITVEAIQPSTYTIPKTNVILSIILFMLSILLGIAYMLILDKYIKDTLKSHREKLLLSGSDSFGIKLNDLSDFEPLNMKM